MRIAFRGILLSLAVLSIAILALCYNAVAQSTSGTIQGVVKDQSGAVVSGAKVEISNPVSGFHRETTTGAAGDFRFANVPFNPYHLAVTAKSFAPSSQDVDVRAAIPVAVDVSLAVAGASTTVEVTADAKDLLEVEPNFHTDIESRPFRQAPARESVLFGQFAGYVSIAQCGSGLEWPSPWDR
jgi:hypothetical protein